MEYKDKIDELVRDRKKFDEIVYTPLPVAMSEWEKRSNDVELSQKVSGLINGSLSEIFRNKPRFVIFRQLSTPDYELYRFLSAADAYDVEPIFWEYLNDKFTSNNPDKHHWGKLAFHYGHGKKGGHKVKYETIIDFNASNGRPIKEVKTLWGQSLKDFHKELMQFCFPEYSDNKFFFDSSEWFKNNGGNAKRYYKRFLAVFAKDAILFENFVLDIFDVDFTKEFFLPAFFDVWQKTGKKPLIVALEPTELENDEFWFCHTPKTHEYLRNKLKDLGYN